MNAITADRAAMKPRSIKVNNMQLVYQLLLEEEPLSIRDIGETLGLSRVSVSKIIGDFSEKGIAYVAGKGSSTVEGGKYPDLYKLNLDYRKVISLYLSKEYFEINLTNMGYEVLRTERVDFDWQISYDGFLDLLCAAIRRVMEEEQLSPEQLLGVVLGLDGVVDSSAGVILFQVHHRWEGKNIPICKDVCERLKLPGVPVYAANISRFVGYSARRALGPDCGSFVMLIAGRNTGTCYISEDLSVRKFGDTELGAVMLDSGRGIDSQGTFTALTSIVRLQKRIAELRGVEPAPGVLRFDQFSAFNLRESGIPDVFAEADAGDPIVRQALDEVIDAFAVMINNLSIVYNPDFIILGGDFGEPGEYFKERLDEAIREGHMAYHGFPVELKYGMDYTDFAAGASFYAALRYMWNGLFD